MTLRRCYAPPLTGDTFDYSMRAHSVMFRAHGIGVQGTKLRVQYFGLRAMSGLKIEVGYKGFKQRRKRSACGSSLHFSRTRSQSCFSLSASLPDLEAAELACLRDLLIPSRECEDP
eukprot:578549-Rhodomonas_salina.1